LVVFRGPSCPLNQVVEPSFHRLLENARLLHDENLINQYKARGRAAVLEHVQGFDNGGEKLLWAGTRMTEGRLCLVREGMHNLFEGVDIAPTQKWCLD